MLRLRFDLQRFADTELTSLAPELIMQAWARDTWDNGKKKSFFDKFTGTDPTSIIQLREELLKGDGDAINIPLLMPLTGTGIEGDNVLEGKSEWLATKIDNMIFSALTDSPTSDRIVYGGTATSIGSIGAADTFDTKIIGRAKRLALANENTQIKPVKVDGRDTFVMVIDQWMARDLKADESFQAAQQYANIRGQDNPIFTGALGWYDGVVIHVSNRIPRDTTGSGGTTVGHGLFLGAQAAVFAVGNQPTWDEKESGRPALTINRIKPLMNLLSGWQRTNRYDIDFLARTPDDGDVCAVRKGITKYILDRCEYASEESAVFLDCAIGGLGYFFVGYEYDDDGSDGEAYVRREDPFGIYVDPEAHKADFSDAKYICRAKWVDKEELKSIYPEHSAAIDAQYNIYDNIEKEHAPSRDELLWYKRELQKVRLVELWYKRREQKAIYTLLTGEEISEEQLTPEMFLLGMIGAVKTVNVTNVRVAGIGGDEISAGFVRDLKDPQREINKRRIQQLHILNTTGNGGGWIEEDAMSEKEFAEFERHGATPGHFQRVRPMALSGQKILERQVGSYPAGLAQAEAQATADLTAISGINEALMGTDIPSAASGRAIELKQKQAIPQFYTEDKVYRVEAINGQQYIRVNQQVLEQDAMGRAIVSTMNDLSQGEFDIVIADVEASTTQRQAQMWNLMDAVSKLGVPGDIVFDIILDLSDIPSKEEYSVRVMINQLYPGLAAQMTAEEAQQQEAAVQQQMMQLPNEVQSPEDFDQQIALAQMINGNNQPQSEPLTKPALDSIRQGLTHAM